MYLTGVCALLDLQAAAWLFFLFFFLVLFLCFFFLITLWLVEASTWRIALTWHFEKEG